MWWPYEHKTYLLFQTKLVHHIEYFHYFDVDNYLGAWILTKPILQIQKKTRAHSDELYENVAM